MNALDALRSAVRAGSWSLAIGTVAAICHAFLVLSLGAAWPASGSLRAALAAVLQAVVVFALTWLAGLVIELDRPTGALTGLWTAALPALVVLAIEGPLGLEPQAGWRVIGAALAMAAALLAVIAHRRRQPGDLTGSGPPSAPTG